MSARCNDRVNGSSLRCGCSRAEQPTCPRTKPGGAHTPAWNRFSGFSLALMLGATALVGGDASLGSSTEAVAAAPSASSSGADPVTETVVAIGRTDLSLQPPIKEQRLSQQHVYLLWGAGCFLVAGLVVAMRFGAVYVRRHRRHKSLWAVRTLSQDNLIYRADRPAVDPHDLEAVAPIRSPWMKRALVAERRAEKANAILRSQLTPHLAQMMKDRLVITLLSQRARLLHHNQAHTERVAALEHRVTGLQIRLEKKTRAYEQRIKDLEQELTVKDRLTRELLKVKVRLSRQALEAVRITPHL